MKYISKNKYVYDDEYKSEYKQKSSDDLKKDSKNRKSFAEIQIPDIVVSKSDIKGDVGENNGGKSIHDQHDIQISFSKRDGKTTHTISKRGRRIARNIPRFVMYGLSCIVMSLLLYGTLTQINLKLRLGSEVIIDGTPVGYVDSKSTVQNILEKIDNETRHFLGDEVNTDRKITYIPRILSESQLTEPISLEQNIMTTNKNTFNGYALYVDGELLCASFSEQDALDAIEKVKQQYLEEFGEVEDEQVEFVGDIEIKREYVTLGYLRSTDGIVSLLTATQEGEVKYTVQEDDTLWSIARENDLLIDDLMEMNEGLAELIHAGDEILLKRSIPQYSLASHYSRTIEHEIPYPVEKIMSDELYEGNVEVVEVGEMGSMVVHESVSKLDGQVTEKIVHSEEIVKEPVQEVVMVGTKVAPKKGDGIFSIPLFGSVTSRFGSRGGSHTGIDWAAPQGTIITAADDGVVIHAGWLGSYGNLVKIDHRNGYVTYYAHCSSILVTNGQEISKGQNIAKVGSTGNSTGPHLHFEVRVDGEPKNPENYLN